MKSKTVYFITLVLFVVLFEALSFVAKLFGSPELTPFLWLALASAASMGGRAIAYYGVFSWAREPFCKVTDHSAGVGESVEPRTDKGDIIYTIGTWMSCPLCAGTWVALGLYLVYAMLPSFGIVMIYVIGAAGLATLFTRWVEKIEWEGRLAWEEAGRENRVNKMFNHKVPKANALAQAYNFTDYADLESKVAHIMAGDQVDVYPDGRSPGVDFDFDESLPSVALIDDEFFSDISDEDREELEKLLKNK